MGFVNGHHLLNATTKPIVSNTTMVHIKNIGRSSGIM